MAITSSDMTIQQRVLNHVLTLNNCLHLLERLPPDLVLVQGYSDGHTTIHKVTLRDMEEQMHTCLEQLRQDCQHWQQPAFATDGAEPPATA